MAIEDRAVHEAQPGATPPDVVGQIPVEDPTTGRIVAHVPDLGAPEIAELARRGRAAQPAWEALGFEGRARVLRRMQKWLTDHAERVIGVIMSETGKTYEDAQLADWSYGVSAFGFWARNAEPYLADERVHSAAVFVKGKKLITRYRPLDATLGVTFSATAARTRSVSATSATGCASPRCER
jgi:acyl-CoA reductase-like NAD-dependent aldehyde dehydrogenase